MVPTSMGELLAQVANLIKNAFNSFLVMFGTVFTALIKISPLPDEVDFLLICMLLIWFTSFLIRSIRGK